MEHLTNDMDSYLNYLLKNALITVKTDSDNSEYQEAFSDEGARKTKHIVSDMLKSGRDYSKTAVISIGGADGSDLTHILMNTNAKLAYLLEYSDDGVKRAEENKKYLADNDKVLEIKHGDAATRITELTDVLIKEEEANNINSVMLICLGVLHELPTRADKYDPSLFIENIISCFPTSFVYMVEPTTPSNWPEEVKLKIGNAKSETLLNFANHIRVQCFKGSNIAVPVKIGPNYVVMNKELAAEVLFKAIRRDTPSRHQYELGERLTSFSAKPYIEYYQTAVTLREDAKKVIEIHEVPDITEGYLNSYVEEKVIAYEHANGVNILPLPLTHVRLNMKYNPYLLPELQRPCLKNNIDLFKGGLGDKERDLECFIKYFALAISRKNHGVRPYLQLKGFGSKENEHLYQKLSKYIDAILDGTLRFADINPNCAASMAYLFVDAVKIMVSGNHGAEGHDSISIIIYDEAMGNATLGQFEMHKHEAMRAVGIHSLSEVDAHLSMYKAYFIYNFTLGYRLSHVYPALIAGLVTMFGKDPNEIPVNARDLDNYEVGIG